MIFNNYLTEEQAILQVKDECKFVAGLMFETEYIYGAAILLREAVYNSNDINMRIKPKQNVRWIMIDNSDQASHGPRIKISKRSQTPNISKKSSHNDYIEIYRSKNNEISLRGSLNNIKMDNREYKEYVDLFIRNENLIRLAQDPNLTQYANSAFINDENMRSNNIPIERMPNGDLIVFKYINGRLVIDYKLNLNGERIL